VALARNSYVAGGGGGERMRGDKNMDNIQDVILSSLHFAPVHISENSAPRAKKTTLLEFLYETMPSWALGNPACCL
jgi:hypothetical protein